MMLTDLPDAMKKFWENILFHKHFAVFLDINIL